MRRFSIGVAAVLLLAMATGAMAEDYTWIGMNTEGNTDYTATDLDSSALWIDSDGNTGVAPSSADHATINQSDWDDGGDDYNKEIVIPAGGAFAPESISFIRTDWRGPWVPIYFQKDMTLDNLYINHHNNSAGQIFRIGTDATDEQRGWLAGTVSLNSDGGVVNIEGNLGNANFDTSDTVTYPTLDVLAAAISGAGIGVTATGPVSDSGTLSLYSDSAGSDQYVKVTRNGVGNFNVVHYAHVAEEDGQQIFGLDQATGVTLDLAGTDPLTILGSDGLGLFWLADSGKIVFSNSDCAIDATASGTIDGVAGTSVEIPNGAASIARLAVGTPDVVLSSNATYGPGYIVRLLDQDAALLTSAEATALNNLDQVDVYMDVANGNYNFYVPGAELNGLKYYHSTTSGRTENILVEGDLATKGIYQATGTDSFVIETNRRGSVIFNMQGNDLDVAYDLRIARVGGEYQVGENTYSRRITANGSIVTIGGDYIINDNQNYAGRVYGGVLEENRNMGISGDATTVVNIGGSFACNTRSLSTGYTGLTESTVNVLGGDSDTAVTWEVMADPTTVDFGVGTSSIGVMNIGASGDPAYVQLVNDELNDNDEANLAKTKDGEVLLVNTLNIVNGTLDLNGLGATVNNATLSISTDGTLDLNSGTVLTPGIPYMKFAGVGDQTAAWNALAAQVTDSTPGNEGLTFQAVYNSGDDKTYFVAKSAAPTGVVSDASLVTATPDVIRNNGADISTVTIYLVDTGGWEVTGLTAGDFVIAAGSAVVTFIGETDPGVSGIYTAELTSTTVAAETVAVTADGTALTTQPTVNVQLPIPEKGPSTVNANRNEVNDTGTIPATLTVYIEDSFGGAIIDAAGMLYLIEDGVDLGATFTEVGGGVYTVDYVGTVAGVYSVQVAFDLGGANEVILDDVADTETMTVYTPGTGVYPYADAGGDQTLDALGCAADVILDASLSFDDVGIAQYKWTYSDTGQTLYSGTDSVVTLSLGVGVHNLLLTVTDDDTGNGVTATDHSDAAPIVVTVNTPVNDSVQLDISSAFNYDVFIGPKEYKALGQWNADYDPNRDLKEVGGTEYTWNPAGDPTCWAMWNNYGQVLVPGDTRTEAYNTAGTLWVLMDQGVREQGIIAGAEVNYHMASYEGNATLSGDWLEVADPQMPDHAPISYYTPGADGAPGVVDVDDDDNGTVDDDSELGWPGSDDGIAYYAFDASELMEGKANAMVVAAAHDRNGWQVAEATATLPVPQQAKYQSINVVLAGFSDPGYNMEIRVVYEDDTEEVLYQFVTGDTPSSTVADPKTDFSIVCHATGRYASSTGSTGALYTTGLDANLYEFAFMLPLGEPGINVKAIKLVDAVPTAQWHARGMAIFAASALPSPEPTNIVDADESSVAIDPLVLPNDNTTAATLTVTLRDLNRMRVTGLTAGDFSFLVAGTGTTTIDNFQDLGNGVYTFDVKSDTSGMKDILVTADGTDLSEVASVDVYSAPIADAGADQVLDATASYVPVTLDGSASYDNDGSIVNYQWQTTDGLVLYNGTDSIIQIVLAAPGEYDIELTVTNDAPDPGPYTATDLMNVAINALTYTTEAIALDTDAANVDVFGTPAEVQAASDWYAYWIAIDTDVVQNGKSYGSWVDTPPVDSWAVGPDGEWGVATVDDDANGTVDDASEAGWPGSDDVAVNSDPSDDVWEPDTATNHLDESLRWAFSAVTDVMQGDPGDPNADEWYPFNTHRWQQPTVALNHLPDTLRGEAGDNGSVQPTITSGYAEYVLQPFDMGAAIEDETQAELPASMNASKMGTVRGASTGEDGMAERTVMLVTPKKYSNINVLMSGASPMTGKRAWFRVVALYQGSAGVEEATVFETPYEVSPTLPYGGDETNRQNWIAKGVPATTFAPPVPVFTGTDGDSDFDDDGNVDLNPVVVGWKYYNIGGNGDTTPYYSVARSLGAGSYYRFWELDSDGVPVDSTKDLIGLRFEVDNGPNYWMTGYPEGDTVLVYAVSGTVAPAGGDLAITDVAIDQAFVYQNAVNSTGDDDTASTGHRATMTVTVDDTYGNSAYTMTVTQSNTGVVRVFDGATDLEKVLKGSFRTDGTAGTGTCDLHIEIAGDVGGTDSADTSIEVRKLGDIDGNASVTTADQVELTKRLNNLVTGTYEYDLDANGSVTTADQVLLTKILNNLTID